MDLQLELVDLTQILDPNQISIYPGDPALKCCPHTTVEQDGYSVQSISLGSHTGTHIDAPCHFISGGKTISEIPLKSLTGPAVVVDLVHRTEREKITWDDDLAPYADQIRPGIVLLLHTGWSKYWATPKYLNHPYLTRQAAEELVARGVAVLGCDTLSPDETGGSSEDFGVHEVVLSAGKIIAENLTNLDQISTGFTIVLAPLNLAGGDGAPVRAFAIRPQESM